MTPVLTRVPVRLPMADGGAYDAVVVIVRDGRLAGLGEAPVVSGRAMEVALAAAERCAALDLDARRRGVRVVDLLGGARREAVECSALVTEPRAAGVAEAVGRLAASGFRCFKLKAANGGGVIDEERLGAARWAAGPKARLRVDFNGGLGLADALRRLPSLMRFGIELFEQPLPAAASPAEWERLRAAGLPVAADESLARPEVGRRLAGSGVALAAKAPTVGGLRETVGLLASAAGAVTIGSSYESSIGIAAALHVACALEREPLACGLATRSRLAADLATGLGPDGPRLGLPAGPGLGVDLDPGALARYAAAG